jgi:replicative DNA helicase
VSDPTILPPMNLAAEQAALGAILLDSKESLPRIRKLLAPIHFWKESHRVIFQAMLDCWDHRNGCVDYVLLIDELERTGKLDLAGGAPYVTSLINATPTCLYGMMYAQVVKDKAIQREQIRRGTEMVREGYDGRGNGRKQRLSVEI